MGAVLGAAGLPEGEGFASKYPCDAGIGSDPRVVFCEDFESGRLNKWDVNQLPKSTEVVSAPGNAAFGKMAVQMTAARGGSTGGGLIKIIKPGHEKLHARFYVKFAAADGYTHHFVHLMGRTDKADLWSGFGGAGRKPSGDATFSTGIEPNFDWGRNPPPGKWMFYTYWHEMKSRWGTGFHPRSGQIPRGKWICIEFMIKCNTPGEKDGTQAVWVDGRLAGFFEGFNWRTSAEVKVGTLWLLHYVTDRAFQHTEAHARKHVKDVDLKEHRVWFDNIVVATDYVGPVRTAPTQPVETGESVWKLIAEKEKARQARGTGSGEEAIGLAKAGDYEAAARAYEALASEGGKDAERFSSLSRALRRAGELRRWVIAGAEAGRKAKTYVEFAGTRLRGDVVSADEEGVTVSCMGNEVKVRWESFPPRRLIALARQYAKGQPERKKLLEIFAEACGLGSP